jgi:uncharacterized membrane protein
MMYQVLLAIHVVGGSAALCVGTAIAVLRKGDHRHKMYGRLFVWTMVAASISGVTMSILKPNEFLLLVGLFSSYMAWSGWRILRAHPMQIALQIIPAVALVVVAIAMAVIAAISQESTVIPLFFAAGMMMIGATDIRVALQLRKGSLSRKLSISRHVSLMGGALIAAWTAFLVVNISLPQFQWILWIGPSVIGTIGLTRAGRRYVNVSP